MARVKEYVINISPISWKTPDQYEHTFFSKQQSDRSNFEIYLQSQHGDDPKFVRPVKLDATFFMPIPKSIAKRKETCWHSSAPTIENLQKFLIGAINETGVIWLSQRLLSFISIRKIYDKNPRTHVVISELE